MCIRDRLRTPKGKILLVGSNAFSFVDVCAEGKVRNEGRIVGLEVEIYAEGVSPYSLAIDQRGIVDVKNKAILCSHQSKCSVSGKITAASQEIGGAIYVFGNEILLTETGHLEASALYGGGLILVGGSFQGKDPNIPQAQWVGVSPHAKICANATKKGNGGDVVVWASEENHFWGTIEAMGGPEGGEDGQIDVASLEGLFFKGEERTHAA